MPHRGTALVPATVLGKTNDTTAYLSLKPSARADGARLAENLQPGMMHKSITPEKAKNEANFNDCAKPICTAL